VRLEIECEQNSIHSGQGRVGYSHISKSHPHLSDIILLITAFPDIGTRGRVANRLKGLKVPTVLYCTAILVCQGRARKLTSLKQAHPQPSPPPSQANPSRSPPLQRLVKAARKEGLPPVSRRRPRCAMPCAAGITLQPVSTASIHHIHTSLGFSCASPARGLRGMRKVNISLFKA
jgi:hypothetical protein